MVNLPKPQRQRDSAYLKWIRTLPCILTGRDFHSCLGPIEANHVRLEGHGGVGTKPDDLWALPFCNKSHRAYHNNGAHWIEVLYDVNLEAEIQRLNAEYQKLHPTPRRPRAFKVRTYQKKTILRGWAVLHSKELQFPIFKTLDEAQRYKFNLKEKTSKIVRCQIRVEGK